MNINPDTLKKEERVSLELRSVFERFGYSKYKMSRFEEYGFYMDYKSFLPSDHVISFTDLDGRLLALKPDVTLSIVKNAKELKGFEKLYYIENVYKPAKNIKKFKEISQLGLEAIGPVDAYTTLEVVTLALRSLEAVEKDFVLDLSHIGIVTGLLDAEELAACSDKEKLLECVVSKNIHDLRKLLAADGVAPEFSAKLEKLITIGGSLGDALADIRGIVCNPQMEEACAELENLHRAIKDTPYEKKVRVDFSIINDINYYNGIIFQGYVRGIPRQILSGGRYDKLLRKFGKGVGAIGFALVLDELAAYDTETKATDADVIVLYDPADDPKALFSAVETLAAKGLKVKTETSLPSEFRYGKLMKLIGGRLEETHV